MFQSSKHSYLPTARAIVLAAAMTFAVTPAFATPNAVPETDNFTPSEGSGFTLRGNNSFDDNPSFVIDSWTWSGAGSWSGPFFPVTAPAVSQNTELTYSLTVTNNNFPEDSDVESIVITVQNTVPPTATAPADFSAAERSLVILDGTATDPAGVGPGHTFSWVQIGGSQPVTINNAAGQDANFTAPEVGPAGEPYAFRFTVTDPGGLSTFDDVTVTISNQNRSPVANAGPDKSTREGSPISFEGIGSDPDGEAVSFLWEQIGGPRIINLDNPTSPTPMFSPPTDVAAEEVYSYRLTVSDPNTAAATDTVQVTVTNGSPPVANAGADDFATERTTVTLQGSATDQDNQLPFSFTWARIAGPSVVLLNPSSPNPTFIAPSVDVDTFITFRLTVTDSGGNTSLDEVSWVIRDVAQALPANPLITNLAIYPSPFSTSSGATIRYDLRTSANVEVLIVDVFGHVVRELSTSRGTAGGFSGTNTLRWDGRNGDGDKLGNGAYIVQVRADDGAGQKGKVKERVGVSN